MHDTSSLTRGNIDPDQPLGPLLSAIRQHDPASPALSAPGLTMRYADLRAKIDALVPAVASLPDGPSVLTMSARAVPALLALAALNRAAVLVPPALRPSELTRVLSESGAGSLLFPESAWHGLDWRRVELGELPVALRDGTGGGLVPSGLCQLSSGSLGPSRLALRSWRGVWAEIEAVTKRLDLRAGDRVWCASSLAHSYGLIGGLLSPLLAGAEVFVGRSAEGTACPAVVFGLAGTYETWIEGRKPDAFGIRWALSAGAPLPKGLKERCVENIGVTIRQDYGTTETGSIAIDTTEHAAPDDVGVPLPHIETRIHEGEIEVTGEAVALGYLRAGQLLARQEQWYRTGDAGTFDEQGRLRLGARMRPVLQRGERLMQPAELEAALERLPGVRQAVVVALPDKRVKAVLVAPGMDVVELEELCRSGLAPEIVPDLIEKRHEFPRSPAGKILYNELAKGDS
ncbi:MAG: class I adenylate-forming enzyme family protein [Chloroflexota bacterium]